MRALGERCKALEQRNVSTIMSGLPFLVRLDGRAFHTFTRVMKRPFDSGFMTAMDKTTKYLVQEFHAFLGYTQSDEITLVFLPKEGSEPLFGGKTQKLCSVIAGAASVMFHKAIVQEYPELNDKNPHFDARVWDVPDEKSVVDVLMWRESDAIRNSINAVGQSIFSTKKLHGKSTRNVLQMLKDKGIWHHDFPPRLRRGAFFQRRQVEILLSDEELQKIPESKRPTEPVIRHEVSNIYLPPLRSLLHPVETILHGRRHDRIPGHYEEQIVEEIVALIQSQWSGPTPSPTTRKKWAEIIALDQDVQSKSWYIYQYHRIKGTREKFSEIIERGLSKRPL